MKSSNYFCRIDDFASEASNFLKIWVFFSIILHLNGSFFRHNLKLKCSKGGTLCFYFLNRRKAGAAGVAGVGHEPPMIRIQVLNCGSLKVDFTARRAHVKARNIDYFGNFVGCMTINSIRKIYFSVAVHKIILCK